MKKFFGMVFLSYFMCYSQSVNSAANDLSIIGVWKIISYQVVGYPALGEVEAQGWVGKLVELTSRKKMVLRDSNGVQKVCPEFSYSVTKQNAEGYFQVGYKIPPNRFGIIDPEVEVVTITCKNESWLGKPREFVKISEELMLSNWDGIFFYFEKQADNFTLLSTRGASKQLTITPQSVGILTPASDFNETTLAQALPGYRIEEQSHLAEDKSKIIDSYELFRQEKIMFKVYPQQDNFLKIGSIEIYDELARAPANAKLGVKYTEVFKEDQQIIDCQAGIGKERGGKTFCNFKKMASIQYIFQPQDDPQGGLSPIEALNEAKLIGFVWIADPTLITESKRSDSTPNEVKPLAAAAVATPSAMTVAPPVSMPVATAPSNTATSPVTPVPSPMNPTIAAADTNLPSSSQAAPINPEIAYKLQDDQLNRVYDTLKEVLKNIETTGKNIAVPVNSASLIEAQRAWIDYRDKNCAGPVNLQAQKISVDIYPCLERITRERVEELRQMLKAIGGPPKRLGSLY